MSVQPKTFHAAFYKGDRPGLTGLYNPIVRWWDHGKFSHCEAVFSDGWSASSSFMDHGVRFKRIDYDPHKWEFLVLPQDKELSARDWFQVHDGEPYDVLGNFRFLADFLSNSPNKWFCNEALLAALGAHDPWRFGPNGAYSLLYTMYEHLQPDYLRIR